MRILYYRVGLFLNRVDSMPTNKEMPQFTHPLRGLGMILIILAVAPPVQVCVDALMRHSWAGGRRVLFEISGVLKEDALPGILAGYSIYMPPVVLAAVLCAVGPARGMGLTLGSAIGRMIVAGLIFELIYQGVILVLGGPFMAGHVMIGLVQWIFSAWISWIIASVFRLDRPVQP